MEGALAMNLPAFQSEKKKKEEGGQGRTCSLPPGGGKGKGRWPLALYFSTWREGKKGGGEKKKRFSTLPRRRGRERSIGKKIPRNNTHVGEEKKRKKGNSSLPLI